METKNEQNVSNKKNRKPVFFLAFILLAFLLLIFSIFLCFIKIKEASNNLLTIKNEIAILSIQAGDIENFKKNYNDYLPNFQKIDQMFVDPQNPLNLIEFLEASASDANVDLEISPLSFSDEGGLKTLNFQLTCTGNFSDELDFLKNIEEGPYLLSIKNAAFSNLQASKTGGKAAAKQPRATFSVKILTQ